LIAFGWRTNANRRGHVDLNATRHIRTYADNALPGRDLDTCVGQ
jgi:hypothetical protein